MNVLLLTNKRFGELVALACISSTAQRGFVNFKSEGKGYDELLLLKIVQMVLFRKSSTVETF